MKNILVKTANDGKKIIVKNEIIICTDQKEFDNENQKAKKWKDTNA